MRSLPALFALLLWYPATASAAETSRLAFVTEYVRELGVNEEIRALAAKEIAEPTDKNAAMIRGSTRIVLELTAQIGMLKGMNLNEPFDKLPGDIAEFYDQKIMVHKLRPGGPKPFAGCSVFDFRTTKMPECILHVDRAGGILAACDALQNLQAPDEYFSDQSRQMMQ
jgi:hypothetical protein